MKLWATREGGRYATVFSTEPYWHIPPQDGERGRVPFWSGTIVTTDCPDDSFYWEPVP